MINRFMNSFDVVVQCDVTAKRLNDPLRYRLYVNDELFVERTWIWQNSYLEENIPIAAPAGVYPIRLETVDIGHGRIKIRNHRVVHGPARIIEYQGQPAVEISDALA